MLFVELHEREQDLREAVERAVAMLRARGLRSFDLPTLVTAVQLFSPEFRGIDLPEEDIARIASGLPGLERRGDRWTFGERKDTEDGVDVPGLDAGA